MLFVLSVGADALRLYHILQFVWLEPWHKVEDDVPLYQRFLLCPLFRNMSRKIEDETAISLFSTSHFGDCNKKRLLIDAYDKFVINQRPYLNWKY